MAAVSLLLLILGVSGAWYVQRLHQQASEILAVNVASIRVAEELELIVHEVRHEWDRYVYTGSDSHLENVLRHKIDVERWMAEAERFARSDEEQDFVAAGRSGLDRFYRQLEQMAAYAPEKRRESADSLSQEVLTTEVLRPIHRYLEVNERELEESNEQNRKLAGRLILGLLLLGTCGSIAGLVAGYGVARGISRSIFQLSVPIRDVAGKLNKVVGPVFVSADLEIEDLENVLQSVSAEVAAVVEKLQDSHREVMRADQQAAVGQLAAGLAHELRNPLMCMKVLVQSARRDAAHRLDGRDLEILDEEIVRLENLLQSFLDFARPATLEKREVDLRGVVQQTVELLAARAARRGASIVFLPPEHPVVVHADQAQLRQVVLNLLLNALDAVTQEGRIRVDVSCEEGGPHGGPSETLAVMRIVDNGRGLPVQDRERIFEPFFSTKETGLGLGLAMCRRIVESHGGQITAADRPEGGAVFTVALPSSEGAALKCGEAIPPGSSVTTG